jgi:uncharacterized membrane protein YidH (DUF202 family)
VSTVSDSPPSEGALERTRLSWMRTSLATIVTGFLLVRGGLTDSEPWKLAVLAAGISVVVVATSVTRFSALGKQAATRVRPLLPRLVAGGIIALAAIAVLRLVLPA